MATSIARSLPQPPSQSANQRTDEMATLRARLIMAALAFGYAPFVFSYAYLHIINQNNMWLPKGVTHPSMNVAMLSFGSMFLSGIIYLYGQLRLRMNDDQGTFRASMWLSWLLGVVAFAGYIYTLGHLDKAFNPGGIFPNPFGGGGYVSVFVSFSIAILPLLFCTLFALLGIANRARMGYYSKGQMAGVNGMGEIWGFTVAIAFVHFGVLYILPFLTVA